MLKGLQKPERKPPRVVLYGPPGVGKSTFGSEAEAPVFVPTENGVDSLAVDQFARAETWDTILANVREVAEGEHKFRSVVIDTLNGAAQLAADHVCKTMFNGNWVARKGADGFNSYGSGWAATSEEMRKLLILLDACREKRGMLVVCLAHTGLQNVKNPTGVDYMKFAPDLDKRVWSLCHAWSDIILRADYDYCVVDGKGKGKAKGTNVRVLYASGDASQDAKTRVGYELPERMSLSYSEFSAALGKSNGTADEVKTLWHLLDSAGEKKALAYLGAPSVNDLSKADATKLRGTLNRLRQLQAEATEKKGE